MNEQPSQPRYIYFFGAGQAEAGNDLKHLVGSKGASLAEMTKAHFNVPPGFTISAECCDLYYRLGKQWPAGLKEQVRQAITRLEQLTGQTLGRGDNPLAVAVRSGAAQSMPGMMDTWLNVGLNVESGGPKAKGGELERGVAGSLPSALRSPHDPWEMLCQAIEAVWVSWNSERAIAYRQHHKVEGLLGTAVNVQAMCHAEVSGVMFTADPVNPEREIIVIESAPGLGELVVQGTVTPDRFVLKKANLNIMERCTGKVNHPSDSGMLPTLTDSQIVELAQLGLRVEAYFQAPCDIEWALADGHFYLLQSRAIKRPSTRPVGSPGAAGRLATHLSPDARELIRREEIIALAALAEPGGTVWARYNLSEILPEPTPMTWTIVRRFMSGRGGFGLMYRDLGFDPDPSLDEVGIYDLVCGRPYCNLSREPKMQYRTLPFEHPFASLKRNPRQALYPQAVLNPARAGWRFWLSLPITCVKLIRSSIRLRKMDQIFATKLREEIIPAFVAETEADASRNWSELDDTALRQRLNYWIDRTLCTFARDSLKPTALAGIALATLERNLSRKLGFERTRSVLGELVMGIHPDPDADLPAAVDELLAGRLNRTDFLNRFGHRGSQEMELAQPRWSEDPAALDRLLQQQRRTSFTKPDPASWEAVAEEARLSSQERSVLEKILHSLRTYLGLRESAKHYLMKGYALIRRILVELDRRHGLEGGIFFLLPDELILLEKGENLRPIIDNRRQRRFIALSLEVPSVLFSDDLEAIGRTTSSSGEATMQGVPLSIGVAEGPALVLNDPGEAASLPDGFILVCPTMDPAWVPLFAAAKGLVMETGGVLSHGAIVAREFGLPAVAGLPGIHRQVRTGQRIRVDGGSGTVTIL